MIRKQGKKTDRDKTPPDIILKAVSAVKIHNLSIRQAILEFNMNYCTVSRYYKKRIYDYQSKRVTINPEYGVNCYIFIVSFKIK